MRFLLDTHALFWAVFLPDRLSVRVRDAITDPDAEVFTSAVSAYEMSFKHGLGKWPEVAPLVSRFGEVMAEQDFDLLALSAAHMLRAGAYPAEHRDPFDRMLAAQAEIEGLVLVTDDRRIPALGIRTLW